MQAAGTALRLMSDYPTPSTLRDILAACQNLNVVTPVMYPSGGSWGGCEDPRMVVIDGSVYITFNMFENWKMRAYLIAMNTEDFLAKRFDRWEGTGHSLSQRSRKELMLFSEKFGGQFAVLHGIIDDDVNRVRVEYTGRS